MLKLNGGKGFFFPRRQRFNEDVTSEIESQRNDLAHKKDKPTELTQGLLANGEVASRASKNSKGKNLTASELSKYFNNKKDANELHSIASASRRSALQTGLGDRKQKYIKKAIDLNNKRYQASQHSSFFGGLITGQHAKNSFYLENGDKTDKVFGHNVAGDQTLEQKDLTKEELAG